MLRHMASLRQIYDKTQFTKELYEKVTRNIRQSYDKMYDSSLAVFMTAARMHGVIISIFY